jgi:aryl-alcohol dehydrogenase-like predicted oxidoreductase
MAKRIGVPAERLAMAFALFHPAVTTVLVGARTTAHLNNALQASQLEFRPEWLDEINNWN